MNDSYFNLKGQRENAGISQERMGELIGATQGMVSRYESDPDSAPGHILRKWNQICGDISNSKGVDIGDPRHELTERQTLIKGYIGSSSALAPNFAADRIPVTPNEFLKGLLIAGRKPRIACSGKFDSGKSRLINTLLGGDRLPTGYQPATSLICFIRHANDKPTWQVEDVVIYKKGFDLERIDDHEHCNAHRLVSGSFDTLKQFGTHNSDNTIVGSVAAVIYIDSPILNAVDFIDLPGHGNNRSDEENAEVGQRLADALIYLSPPNGFMDIFDIEYFKAVLGNIPVLDFSGKPSDALRNVFVVNSLSHLAPAEKRPGILSGGAKRCGEHILSLLQDRYRDESVDPKIILNDFNERFFAFSVEDIDLRELFIKDLTAFLTDAYSKFSMRQTQSYIQLSKERANKEFTIWIGNLTRALDEREKAQEEIRRIRDGEEDRQIKKNLHFNKINSFIDKCASESQLHIENVFNRHTSVDAIEAVIKHRYSDKKEAQSMAPSYVLSMLQNDINNGIKEKSAVLSEEIDDFLGGFSPSINKNELENLGWSFNPKVAFMSALSGIGTVGALATWASIAAAGSNLGGYILIGQIVGWLSSIGVSLGGAGTVMAWVSAIGGPLTLAIGAGILIGILTFGIFGDSWQTKLAKKIHSEILKKGVKKKFIDGIAKYWADTKSAFSQATLKTEDAYQEKLKSLEDLAFSTDPEIIKKELDYAEELRGFFARIPWRTIQQ